MASPIRWTWILVNSGSCWWTGRLDVLQFMGSQRVRHDWATELNSLDSNSPAVILYLRWPCISKVHTKYSWAEWQTETLCLLSHHRSISCICEWEKTKSKSYNLNKPNFIFVQGYGLSSNQMQILDSSDSLIVLKLIVSISLYLSLLMIKHRASLMARGKKSVCHCRIHKFNRWSRNITHAVEQLSSCATTIEPVL